jgi:cation:H+ antiporter
MALPGHIREEDSVVRANVDGGFMAGLPSSALIAIFAFGGVATWVAGIYLSKSTDALDDRLRIGEALGGMVLLAIAGSLPELAITVAAALRGNFDIAAGNLIGGIAVQTMVLAVLDIAVPGNKPLSYLVGSLLPVLEAALVIGLTALVLMGSLLPPSAAFHGVSPASLLIVVFWLLGLWVIERVRKEPAWEVVMPGSRSGRTHRRSHVGVRHPYGKTSTLAIAAIFGAGSVVTLVAGAALEISGAELATRAGINGVIFGATVLAFVSALPELSTGIAAVRLGDNQLAMSDVFGGNAFQVCLFLLADIIAGRPVLTVAGRTNAWLATLGIVLSLIYAMSVVVRPSRRILRLGLDSVLAIVLFAVGIVGLVLVAR